MDTKIPSGEKFGFYSKGCGKESHQGALNSLEGVMGSDLHHLKIVLAFT